MSDHYSDVRNTIYRQQKEAQRKSIKSIINKMKDDDLQLVEEFLGDIEMFKNFFSTIKKITKMDL
jgi:hypothetical protein